MKRILKLYQLFAVIVLLCVWLVPAYAPTVFAPNYLVLAGKFGMAFVVIGSYGVWSSMRRTDREPRLVLGGMAIMSGVGLLFHMIPGTDGYDDLFDAAILAIAYGLLAMECAPIVEAHETRYGRPRPQSASFSIWFALFGGTLCPRFFPDPEHGLYYGIAIMLVFFWFSWFFAKPVPVHSDP